MGADEGVGMTADQSPPDDQRLWRLLLPWAVLPVALAIITLVDWLNRGRRRQRRREAA